MGYTGRRRRRSNTRRRRIGVRERQIQLMRRIIVTVLALVLVLSAVLIVRAVRGKNEPEAVRTGDAGGAGCKDTGALA